MAITQYYDLDLVPNGAPVVVNCSQYDEASRLFMFTMYEDGQLATIPSGSNITIRGYKPDKTAFSYAGTRVNANQISVKLHEQMAAVAGNVTCELRIMHNGETLGTANFILFVERSPYGDDVVISETQMSEFETAVQAGQLAEEAMELVTPLVPENEGQTGWVLSKTDTGTQWVQMTAGGTVKSVNQQQPDSAGNVDLDAEHIDYDNTSSGMTATTVQEAIDEHEEDIVDINEKLDVIGTFYYSEVPATGVNIPAGTLTSLVSIDLPPGTYVMSGFVGINNTGSASSGNTYRLACISSNGTSATHGYVEVPPVTAGNTAIEITTIMKFDTNRTIHLMAQHNKTGVTLKTVGGTIIKAVRIA